MKKQRISRLYFFTVMVFIFVLQACSPPASNQENKEIRDTLVNEPIDTTQTKGDRSDSSQNKGSVANNPTQKADVSTVLIYNFHITNRCVSCIAIEDATTKTINNYFSAELKQGRIKRYILNVDDEANSKIAEKYQAFGSGLFVTRSYKGKETTTDLTGDGFKYAKNKEEKFIEILKSKISEYLK